MFWRRPKLAPVTPHTHTQYDAMVIAVDAMRELVAEIRTDLDRLKNSDPVRKVDDLDTRLSKLERSDFALNKEAFDRTLRELEDGTPGIPFPLV